MNLKAAIGLPIVNIILCNITLQNFKKQTMQQN